MSDTTLVAVDLAHAEDMGRVLKRAKALADLDQATLAVITVIPDFGMSIVGTFFDRDTMDKALHEAQDRLHALVKDVLGDDSAIQHVVAQGNAYEEILKTADELKASLIVMGAHRPELKDYLLGPNAARVVRHSKCSVHVLRD